MTFYAKKPAFRKCLLYYYFFAKVIVMYLNLQSVNVGWNLKMNSGWINSIRDSNRRAFSSSLRSLNRMKERKKERPLLDGIESPLESKQPHFLYETNPLKIFIISILIINLIPKTQYQYGLFGWLSVFGLLIVKLLTTTTGSFRLDCVCFIESRKWIPINRYHWYR